MGNPSFSFSILSFLSATISPGTETNMETVSGGRRREGEEEEEERDGEDNEEREGGDGGD